MRWDSKSAWSTFRKRRINMSRLEVLHTYKTITLWQRQLSLCHFGMGNTIFQTICKIMLQNTIWQMEEEIQIQKDIKPAHVLKNILWIVVFKQQLTVILVLLRCGGQEWRQESESYAKTIFSTRKKALINIWKLFWLTSRCNIYRYHRLHQLHLLPQWYAGQRWSTGQLL